MEQYDESHPIEDAIHNQLKLAFQGLHSDDPLYAICHECVIYNEPTPHIAVPVVMTHHRRSLHLTCYTHWLNMCEHMGGLVSWETYRGAKPMNICLQ